MSYPALEKLIIANAARKGVVAEPTIGRFVLDNRNLNVLASRRLPQTGL